MNTKSSHALHSAKRRYVAGTSRKSRSADTLRAQMEDVARGERLKELRNARHLSQPAVVDLVNERAGEKLVGLRGYQAWEAGGGIRWEKAKVLAEVLGTDPEHLMNGAHEETPDPFAGSVEERLADLTEQLAADRVDRDDNIADVKALLNQQNALLARQSKILDGIENLLATQLSAARQMEDAATELRAATARRQSLPRTSPRASSSKN